jgi:gas vesicle protein
LDNRGNCRLNSFRSFVYRDTTGTGSEPDIEFIKWIDGGGLHERRSGEERGFDCVGKKLKKDIKDVKEDIQGVKKELREVKEQTAINTFDIHEIKTDVREFRDEMNEKFDTVLTAIDGLAGLITNGQVEKAATESALYSHERTIENQEGRIEILEKKTV